MKNKMVVTIMMVVALLVMFPVQALAFWPTPIPIVPPMQIDEEVDVPDAVLNAELHKLTGVPEDKPLYKSDLESLTGFINVSGVANAEGIQYCVNLPTITLHRGTLSDMPDMSQMTALRSLYLDDNQFETVPKSVCQIPNLITLSMCGNKLTDLGGIGSLSQLKELILMDCGLDEFPAELYYTKVEELALDGNPMGALPDDLSQMQSLRYLGLRDTGLGTVPDVLFEMAELKGLSLADNRIVSIPDGISVMAGLEGLDISGNAISSLPAALCGMENLESLDVCGNRLNGLPDGIGNHLRHLAARYNSITSLPASLATSDSLRELDLTMNQLTSLPDNFGALDISTLDIQFNFLDMSEDSLWRQMLDESPTETKYYLNQLTLPDVSAQTAPDSVTLTWMPGQEHESVQTSWKVTGYEVYRYVNGKLILLAELGSDILCYTDTGLDVGAAYEYRVAVIYAVSDEIRFVDGTTRGYSEVSIATSEAAAEYTTVIITPAPSNIGTVDTTGIMLRERPGIPWPVYAGVGGLLLAGAGITTVLTKRKRSSMKKPE